MTDQIVVLKNTKKGLQIDTVYNSNDTLFLGLSNKTTIEIPEGRLEVNTHPPENRLIDDLAIWAAVVGGIAAMVGAFLAFYQLFKKDKDKQIQLDRMTGLVGALEAQNDLIKQGNDNMRNYLIELTKVVQRDGEEGQSERMIELEEQRLRLLTKPRIWTNGGGYRGTEKEIKVSIDNRGELCYVDDFEIVEGDQVNLRKWKQPVTLVKDGNIYITGILEGDIWPKDAKFKLRLDYHDQENYHYQSIIQWTGGSTRLLETIELPKND